jgi:hypothetical protein
MFVDFFATQNYHGLQLVGLRWSSKIGSDFRYYSKPNPYVPIRSDSNTFWMGLFLCISFWVMILLVALFAARPLVILTALVGTALQVLNFVMFVKAHRMAKIAAELAVKRQLELADTVTFELVRETELGANRPEDKVGPDEPGGEVV